MLRQSTPHPHAPGIRLRLLTLPTAVLLASLFVTTTMQAEEAAAEFVKPKALEPGDTIMFVAPAGELIEERIQLAAERLREMGFKVIVPDDLFRVRGYLAGPDERRAEELMQAFTDPEVDAIFPGTGGYGTMRILELLDYEKIAANPKVFIGFSDITGLHLALQAKCGMVTFHSPNPSWGLGNEQNLHPFSAKYFWRNLLEEQNRAEQGFLYEMPDDDPIHAVSAGVGEGPLTGGNLSLVAALTGTEYAIDTAGKVLFLEDVREAPYRVDRMLCQMRLAGALDQPAAVILGKFTRSNPDPGESSLGIEEVFDDYFADAPYPVIKNFSMGHTLRNATLPVGARVRVDADRLKVRLLENPVSVD